MTHSLAATPGYYEAAPGSNVAVLVPDRDEKAQQEFAAVAELAAATALTGNGLQMKLPNGEIATLPQDVSDVIGKAAALFAQGTGAPLFITRRPDLLETPPPSENIGVREAAEMVGVSEPTMRRIIDAGRLGAARPGSHRRLRRADVEAFIRQTTFGNAENE